MMMRIMMRNCFSFANFKIDEFDVQDYSTMCGLMREKYQMNNEEIQTSGLIKLLDDKSKVIGIYTASEARKKSLGMGLDMVLVNMASTPIVCRASDFRKRVVNKFYEGVVLKRQKQMQSKATSTKSLKVSANLNSNEMKLKLKQLVELSQKNLKVRVFMMVKEAQRDECLSKLEEIKSELMNKCYIEEEISNKRFAEVQEEDEEDKFNKKEKTRVRPETYSFVVRARESNLARKALEEKEMDCDVAVKTFLRRYYSQEDGEMMDLKSAGLFEVDKGADLELQTDAKLMKQTIVEERQEDDREEEVEPEILREVDARILNSRLKSLLSLYK